ncbi:CHAT domain-containing protein [Aquimarina sp. MAR_2010_214]|uniref:CHAT domain-containing protein n=1 Tax=Aquimarina sp. MAR_2010_214 TaxID=1250026 RepID=UPI000CAB5C38|nr:CHAT domain-containing tetratricopeptide repeat protein [Aquimarina sp. MAR_2010_214]PKV51996.1 CHAT domain-containing protein [Aquimarina sp. MAR_2010_214]
MNTLMSPLKFLFPVKIVFLILCLISCYAIQGQSTQDTIIASQYFSKGEELLADRKQDSALVYFKKALTVYRQSNAQQRVVDCYDKIAEAYKANYNFDQAMVYAKKALDIRLKMYGDHHSDVAKSYNSIGYILKEQDQYEEAMEYYQKALTIQLNAYGDKDHHVADCYHNIGTIHHVLAQYDQAMEQYEKALSIRINTFGNKHQKIADSYIDIGTTYYHLGKYNLALENYQKALEIRAPVFGANSPEVAFCYNHIGNILDRFDRYDDALEYQEKALAIMVDVFGRTHLNVALCYESLGTVYRLLGKHDAALLYDNKALTILVQKLGKTRARLTNIYTEIGNINFKKGKYNQSLEYYQKSLTIELKVYPRQHSYLGADYNNIGSVYQYRGEYEKALLYYKKAVINFIHSLGRNHSAVARAYNNIANTYKAKEEYGLALSYYQKALTIRINTQGEYHSDTSHSYFDMGDLYVLKKEYDIALMYYLKTLRIQISLFGEMNYYVSDIYNTIANLYTEQEKYDMALEYLQKSITIRLRTDGDHHPRTAKSYNQIAEVYHQTKKHKKAIQYYEKAIAANTNLDKKSGGAGGLNSVGYMDLNILLNTFYGKARVLQERFNVNNNPSDLKESIVVYQKADNLMQDIRESLHTYQDKLTFAKQAQKIYAGAIQVQLLLHQINQKQESLQQAFYYAEKSKANTLKELLAESNVKSFLGLPKTILDQEQHLKSERSFCISEVIKERSKEVQDTAKIITYENKLFDLDRKQDSLTQVIEKNYPKYYQLKHQNKIISVAGIQGELNENTTLLEFFVSDSSTYAFTISKKVIQVTTLHTPDLNKNIEDLRAAIVTKNTIFFKTISYKLYNQLINPIKDQIKGGQLIIVPDGSLWHLNFELLLIRDDVSYDPKVLSYLLKEYAISYASSANLLFAPFQSGLQSKKRQECLAFSFSDGEIAGAKTMSLAALRAANYDLPGTRKEIKAISDIIDGQYYFGSQAIEANFKKKAGQYNILHLALHGDVDNEHPENSKLLFTKGNDTIEDSYLYSHELFAMNIPAELTVLSACNTGSGKIAKGEGIMSLGNAFQYAGTKSLLLSSWEISDQTTPELMKLFYKNLKAGMHKAKALQQAKLQYLNTANINRTDPFYWGGFYLVGDPSPISFKDSTMLYWVIGLGALTLLCIGVFWYQRKKKNV